MPDINDKTGLPHEMSLGEVLNNIKLAPAEIGAFLSHLGAGFAGGPNSELQAKLNAHATNITNPETYNDDKRGPLDANARLDAQGREVTPRYEPFVSDAVHSPAHLNPGMVSAAPVDEPARIDYAQREPNPQRGGESVAEVEQRSFPETAPRPAIANPIGGGNPQVEPDTRDTSPVNDAPRFQAAPAPDDRPDANRR